MTHAGPYRYDPGNPEHLEIAVEVLDMAGLSLHLETPDPTTFKDGFIPGEYMDGWKNAERRSWMWVFDYSKRLAERARVIREHTGE